MHIYFIYTFTADPKQARLGTHQTLYMILARVLLGNTYVWATPKPFKDVHVLISHAAPIPVSHTTISLTPSWAHITMTIPCNSWV